MLVVGAFWGLGLLRPRPRPNILLIVLDTTRWDHLSCYGYHEKTTPAIDKLAEEGVRYEYALSPSSWTLPAHASLFTGALPTHHGAHFMSEGGIQFGVLRLKPLDSRLPTLAEELGKAGYRTLGVVSTPMLSSSLGVSRGFEYYYDWNIEEGEFHRCDRSADETTAEAIRLLRKFHTPSDTAPLFLFLNYYDPHNPYHAPQPWGNPKAPGEIFDIQSPRYVDILKGSRDLKKEEQSVLLPEYDAEITFMDSQIGALLEEMKRLGLYDSTLIIVTADHGESFGEHRLLSHGLSLYEDLVRVPLIIKYPKKDKKGGIVKTPVSIMGIMPTILEYIGQPVPETVDNGAVSDRRQLLITELHRNDGAVKLYGKRFDKHERAAYEGDYKWIWNSNGKHELYNILKDPGESNNLFGKLPDLEKRFQSILAPLIGKSVLLSPDASHKADSNLEKNLKSLGYIQ
ncbi:MAG: sulfatase [Candidatus Lindowbacteria bacterium]|nr:sulfatase [Candidatus Lindowbacteria bacterium]